MFKQPTPLQKLLDKSHALLRMSHKVYAYRRDILSPNQRTSLCEQDAHLKSILKTHNESEIKKAYSALDQTLKTCGGKIYPVSFWSENIEMFLVAAILAIGIRTFFFQPFKIPTNSMYPTYAGMTPYVYSISSKPPPFLHKLGLTITQGASHFELTSTHSGQVSIPIFTPGDPISGLGRVKFRQVKARKWLGLLPTINREYTLLVDNHPVTIEVPFDFSLDEVIRQTYFPEYKSIDEAIEEQRYLLHRTFNPTLQTNTHLKPNQPVLQFAILSGDMLFVNRFIYHFKGPQIGDAIIFPTRNIPGLQAPDGRILEDKYYIKRLVGLPGDQLSIIPPVLYRNNKAITGAPAFNLNAEEIGSYKGYAAIRRLAPGKTETIPKNQAYAMGDNSYHSGDSRFWGPLSQDQIIGRASFIFYPFSNRFGLAQ